MDRSPSEVVRLRHNQDRERVAAFQRLKASLEMGAAQAERGELLDPEIVFEELREMIEERRRAKSAQG